MWVQLCGSSNILFLLPFFGIGMKADLFQSCGHRWVFQIYCIEYNTITASSFRIWNSSTGIPSPPLALFVWCFLRPTWLCTPGCLALSDHTIMVIWVIKIIFSVSKTRQIRFESTSRLNQPWLSPMSQHIWSPSWEKVPGSTSTPWVRLQRLQPLV